MSSWLACWAGGLEVGAVVSDMMVVVLFCSIRLEFEDCLLESGNSPEIVFLFLFVVLSVLAGDPSFSTAM